MMSIIVQYEIILHIWIYVILCVSFIMKGDSSFMCLCVCVLFSLVISHILISLKVHLKIKECCELCREPDNFKQMAMKQYVFSGIALKMEV